MGEKPSVTASALSVSNLAISLSARCAAVPGARVHRLDQPPANAGGRLEC